jgi:hypothetical protein
MSAETVFDTYYFLYDKNFIYRRRIALVVMSDDTLAAFVAEHPKMAGVLFTTLLLLSQAGGAMAGHGTSYPGP